MATADDPFEQLYRSHRRLEERLEDLPRAAKDLGGPRRAEALTWLSETAAWMERAVRRHEEDEERSLFPRLTGRPELESVLTRLADEHRAHERLYGRLANIAGLSVPEAETLAEELQQALRHHIAEEEGELFPRARAVLDADALAAICAEMAARRGR